MAFFPSADHAALDAQLAQAQANLLSTRAALSAHHAATTAVAAGAALAPAAPSFSAPLTGTYTIDQVLPSVRTVPTGSSFTFSPGGVLTLSRPQFSTLVGTFGSASPTTGAVPYSVSDAFTRITGTLTTTIPQQALHGMGSITTPVPPVVTFSWSATRTA